MIVWFALTLFVSAALLFLIQPLIAKMILPLLGGTPAVWNTCMVFFQAVLLAGYCYAHAATRRLGVRRQALVHGLVLLVPLFLLPLITLPLGLAQNNGEEESFLLPLLRGWQTLAYPIPWLLLLLAVSAGLPLFVVAASAPLLQRWFASTGHPAARDPYFLYAASNLGSMLALVGYPVLVEPHWRLLEQSRLWSAGYVLLLVLIGGCAVFLWRSASSPSDQSFQADGTELEPGPTLGRRLHWLLLALVPSSMLLGVTTYLSTDIAAIPLLWVVPLALYLLSWIVVFARAPLVPHQTLVWLLPFVVLGQTFVFNIVALRPVWVLLLLHLAVFFLVALVCHGELARDRPSPRHLTEFYLWISLGGALGGMYNALVAPLIFSVPFEYPLALVLACLVVPAVRSPERLTLNWLDVWLPLGLMMLLVALRIGWEVSGLEEVWLRVTLMCGLPAAICYTFLRRPLRFALGVGAILLAGGASGSGPSTSLVHSERSFFGVMQVVDKKVKEPVPTTFREFVHGTTIHGRQCTDPSRRREPLTYYFRNGPMGQIFAARGQTLDRKRIAVLGLGAGTLASYGEKGQEWIFYEIDAAVARIAEEYFTFLQDCRERGATVQVEIGDARLTLARGPARSIDLIFADAFSSDAVPVHLITREALRIYLDHLAEGGVLIFNAANRYLDLEPVFGDLAADAGLVCRARTETEKDISPADLKQGKTSSHWVVMARRAEDLGFLADDPNWKDVRGRPGSTVWTDDFSNLLSVFRWF